MCCELLIATLSKSTAGTRIKVFSTAVIDPADNQILSVEDIQKPQLVITTYHRNNPDVPFNFFCRRV